MCCLFVSLRSRAPIKGVISVVSWEVDVEDSD